MALQRTIGGGTVRFGSYDYQGGDGNHSFVLERVKKGVFIMNNFISFCDCILPFYEKKVITKF